MGREVGMATGKKAASAASRQLSSSKSSKAEKKVAVSDPSQAKQGGSHGKGK